MLYKLLKEDGSATNGGHGKWPLPVSDKPGKWLEIKGKLDPCRHGLHLCRFENILQWAAPALYEVEYEGEIIDRKDKVVVRRARLLRKVEGWNERNLRLFACDCAEFVLHLFEDQYPNDFRPRKTIKTVRHYAEEKASTEELAIVRNDAYFSACFRDTATHAATYAAYAAYCSAIDSAVAAADGAVFYAVGAIYYATFMPSSTIITKDNIAKDNIASFTSSSNGDAISTIDARVQLLDILRQRIGVQN